QAGLGPGAQVRALAVAARDRDRCGGGRLGDHAGLLVRAEVAIRAACHPEQEEVEHREEPELEGNCYWVLHRYSSSKPSDTRPSVISSPGESTASRTRLPLTLIPFVEPRSTTVQPSIVRRTSACLREMFGSSMTTSHSRLRPIVVRSAVSTV